ncbi:MAG: hypothetical protein ACE15F_08005 [bacterium]
MSFEPSPLQALLIWKLILTGEEPAVSKVKPKLLPKPRNELKDAQFIDVISRGRANHIILLDRAWRWAEDNMDIAINTRSPEIKTVLHNVLSLLKYYMQTNNVKLSEFVQIASRKKIMAAANSAIPATSPPSTPTPADLEQQIRDAYFQASGGEARKQIRLRRLRDNLRDLPRSVLDEALCRMKSDHKIILYPLDDPLEITPADQDAALTIAGRNNHIIILEG